VSAFLSSSQNFSWVGRLFYFFMIITLLCLCLPSSSRAEEGHHLLDGKSYVGKNGEKGQKLAEYEDEEIIFQDGKFTSVSCEPYSFSTSPYTAKSIGNKIHFTAVTESTSHGEISWQGVVENDQVEVSFVWTKERWYWNVRREYWFHGMLKK
jgi:hypothetical protein